MVKRTYLVATNGDKMPAKGTGTVPLTIGDQQVTLKSVLYAPSTQMNLVSITGLQQAGLTNVLSEETGLVTSTLSDSDSTITIGHYDPIEKLYVLLNNNDTVNHSSGASIAPITTRTRLTTVAMTLTEAHQSLGHLNHSTLLQAYRNNTLHGNKLTNLKWEGCASCDKCKGGETHMARQTTATYNESGYICSDLMDFRGREAHNFHYISSFIDISTRYCSIELLKIKDAHLTLAHFRRFVSILQIRTGHSVKQLLTDNGLFHSYRISQGISQRLTAPFTPAHNGIAERKNRTLLEALRTTLDSASLDNNFFWGELILGICHVQNRLPHSALDGLSPYEALFKRKPTLNYLKPLGSTIYVQRNYKRAKLDPVFDEAILVGYSENSSEYRVYNTRTHEFLTSRNVKFSSSPPLPTNLQEDDSVPQDELSTVDIDNTELDTTHSVLATRNKQFYDPDFPTMSEVLNGPDSEEWRLSLENEKQNLLDNAVIEEVPNVGQRCLNVIPVFRIKRDRFGNLKQRKTRFVVQGFRQVEGVDYNETYAPVGQYSSLLAILKYALANHYRLGQIDFVAAFLNAPLKEEIYISRLPGVPPPSEGNVYQLKKALYGLKQAPFEWWTLLKTTLTDLKWTGGVTDNCVFKRSTPHGDEFIFVYVDDLIIASPNDETLQTTKQELANVFPMSDLGDVEYILGIAINHDKHANSMHLSNTALIEKYCTMYNCVPPSTYKSLPSLLHVATLSSLKTSTGFASFSSLKLFSTHDCVSRTGALDYFVRRSRPDLAAVAGYLQRRQNCFTLEDCIHLQRAFSTFPSPLLQESR